MSATKLLESLSDEQKAIIAAKTVTLNRSADELLKLLKPIAVFDAAAAPARTKAGCWMGGMIFLTVVAGIAALTQEGTVRMAIFAAGVAMIVAAVIFGRTYGKLKAADVSDNLSAVVIPFLTILREDVPPDVPVAVDIDLTQANVKEKLINEIKPENKGYPKIVTRFYSNPWFEGSTVFADGTHVEWEVVDRLRVTEKTKKNPRGKIKTKTKMKLRSSVEVKLGFPSKRFAPKRGEAVDGKRHEVKLEKRALSPGETPQGFRLLIDLIADGYRSVAGQKGAAR